MQSAIDRCNTNEDSSDADRERVQYFTNSAGADRVVKKAIVEIALDAVERWCCKNKFVKLVAAPTRKGSAGIGSRMKKKSASVTVEELSVTRRYTTTLKSVFGILKLVWQLDLNRFAGSKFSGNGGEVSSLLEHWTGTIRMLAPFALSDDVRLHVAAFSLLSRIKMDLKTDWTFQGVMDDAFLNAMTYASKMKVSGIQKVDAFITDYESVNKSVPRINTTDYREHAKNSTKTKEMMRGLANDLYELSNPSLAIQESPSPAEKYWNSQATMHILAYFINYMHCKARDGLSAWPNIVLKRIVNLWAMYNFSTQATTLFQMDSETSKSTWNLVLHATDWNDNAFKDDYLAVKNTFAIRSPDVSNSNRMICNGSDASPVDDALDESRTIEDKTKNEHPREVE